MAQPYFSLVTMAGRNKLAASAAGGPAVAITHFAIGDGNGADTNPTAASTALVREVWRTAVESVVIDPDNPSAVLVTAIIPTTAGGWWMREFGVFDTAGTMIAVARPVSQYKPTGLEGQLEDIRYEFQIIVGETANVTLLVDPSVLLASRDWVMTRKIPMAQMMRTPWLPVVSMTVTAPPAAPAIGDTYLVPAGATGVWAANVGKLAEWSGSAWSYLTPPNGHGISLGDGRVYVRLDGVYVEKIAVDAQSGKWTYAVAGGAANALTAALTPAVTALVEPLRFLLKTPLENTTGVTVDIGTGPVSVVRINGSALQPGDFTAGGLADLVYSATLQKLVLLNPQAEGRRTNTVVLNSGVNAVYVPSPGVRRLRVKLKGAGAGAASVKFGSGYYYGTDGGDTTFGDPIFGTTVAKGGKAATSKQIGGLGGRNGTGPATRRTAGSQGGPGSDIAGGVNITGGYGASSSLGGAGTAGAPTGAGRDAEPNSGSGGGGPGGTTAASADACPGGGSGEEVERIITGSDIQPSYTYTIGAGGAPGTTVGISLLGGRGGSGVIEVEEEF